MNDKRLEQKKESWIKNIIKVQGLTNEEAENLYDKIKPFEIEILKSLNNKILG